MANWHRKKPRQKKPGLGKPITTPRSGIHPKGRDSGKTGLRPPWYYFNAIDYIHPNPLKIQCFHCGVSTYAECRDGNGKFAGYQCPTCRHFRRGAGCLVCEEPIVGFMITPKRSAPYWWIPEFCSAGCWRTVVVRVKRGIPPLPNYPGAEIPSRPGQRRLAKGERRK